MKMHKFFKLLLAALILPLLSDCNQSPNELKTKIDPESEIFYHVFQRSFYDSNGDHHGDLKGLQQKLDYLQELGVTAVLMTPLYESDYYHNYFPTSFEKIDPEFGSKADYFALLQDMHHRGMKLIMDMEIHYVTEKHDWYKDSYKNPSSAYSDYVVYNGPGNTEPETIVFNLTGLESYDGTFTKIATTDLYNEKVRKYHYDLFKYWIDPNKDGNLEDGIDGFRIDHIMDDLDWKGKFTGLLANFWKPLFTELRAINPDLILIGEQADWSYGADYFEKGDLSHVFAFPLSQAIRKFEAGEIQNKADTTLLVTPNGKHQLIFVENHDMSRIATEYKSNTAKLKIAAALNLLLKGVPIIYYGQEIGMTGAGGFGAFGNSDGNDIPRREAFEWYRTVDKPGMALWYKDSGPWWEQTNLKNHDGISLEEQKDDPSSLWQFYKGLINLRKSNKTIQTGNYRKVELRAKDVIAFIRSTEKSTVFVAINLNDSEQVATSTDPALSQKQSKPLFSATTAKEFSTKGDAVSIHLDPYDVQVWEVK
ncbi:MAG: alpha-glucosidase C-terminal domain-containing protein [Deferribacteres bacterium]|nr:alpha-glucosidase C-terminal domain-containing protein [candidate division KSB1 bacterium]MCB9501663.1 alpha-glucosidase C-terminal domain-containing protein [Deferribacteres bacterium]